MLSGEQNCPLGVQGFPLVTLCPLLAQVHRTVSPTRILTVSGTNAKPCPTVTSKIVLVIDRTPFTAGCPFSSTIVSGSATLDTPGRGAGVGRGLGVTAGLAVGVGLGVAVAVAVGVAVAVAVGVDVGVEVAGAVAVAVGLAVGVGVPAGSLNAYTLLSAPK